MGLQAFALPWRTHLEFRAEVFNLLNRTNFRAPTQPQRGQLRHRHATYDPRIMQLGVKLVF